MLLYSAKLNAYVRNKILIKILLTNNYKIKGSFRRKVPYITDIDLTNQVYPTISKSDLYQKILDCIMHLPHNIIFLQISCGTDERFKHQTESFSQYITRIRDLLPDEKKKQLDSILIDTKDITKREFLINELIWDFYKIRFLRDEVFNNRKVLSGGMNVSLTDMIDKNNYLLLQYTAIIQGYPVGIDMAIYYEKTDESLIYQSARKYYYYLANYQKEYYFLLFPLRVYFSTRNRSIYDELNNIIEKDFGGYKQLCVRIEQYTALYKTNNLQIDLATIIVKRILEDTLNLTRFKSQSLKKITHTAMYSPIDNRIEEWNNGLDELYKDLNSFMNTNCEKYFDHYLNLVDEKDRSNILII